MGCNALFYFQGGDIEKATDWIFSNPDPSSLDLDATTSNTAPTPTDAGLPDGGGSEFLLYKFIYFFNVILSHTCISLSMFPCGLAAIASLVVGTIFSSACKLV